MENARTAGGSVRPGAQKRQGFLLLGPLAPFCRANRDVIGDFTRGCTCPNKGPNGGRIPGEVLGVTQASSLPTHRPTSGNTLAQISLFR